MQWFTDAGLVIETTSGSRPAIVFALGAFAVLALWRGWRDDLALPRLIVATVATLVGAWAGGAWLGPILFDAPGYSSLVAAAVATPLGLVVGSAAGLSTRRLADIMAPPALVATAVARVGCLFQGCDFGSQSDAAWAVRHRVGTRAFDWQRHTSMVGDFARLTEPVHPFALYEALPLMVVALVLWRLRPGPGHVAWLSVIGWALVRAVAELFRAQPIELVGIELSTLLFGIAILTAAVGWWIGPARRRVQPSGQATQQ